MGDNVVTFSIANLITVTVMVMIGYALVLVLFKCGSAVMDKVGGDE